MIKIEVLLQLLQAFYPKTSNALKIIGFIVVAQKFIKLLLVAYRNILRRKKNLIKRYGNKTWALITGSSDGIGKAIAFALAKQGFNIILSARTQSKLRTVKIQMLKSFPAIDVRILTLDYVRSSDAGYLEERISSELNDIEISILVNNVGLDVLDYYHTISQDKISSLIRVNCFSTSILSNIFIPKFLERHKKNKKIKSAIINVASLAGEIPMPLHNVYSASKAFVETLSRALSYQYQKEIDIISLNPSEVSTPMTYNKKLDLLTIAPKQCAEALLNDLGHDRMTNGHWTHKIQSSIYHFLPEPIFNFVWLNYIGPDFIKERNNAIQKRGQI